MYENQEYQTQLKEMASIRELFIGFKNTTFLITGATGMIGKTMIQLLLFANEKYFLNLKIKAMGRSIKKAETRLKSCFENTAFEFIEHDINLELDSVKTKLVDIDYIIHGASTTHPLAYASEPIETITSNIWGLKALLDLSVKQKIKRFVFLSTVEIYGENRGDVERFNETYMGYLNCNTVRAGYPESKRLGEALCQAYKQEHNMDVVIPRLCRVYGQTMQESDSKAIAQFIKKGINKEDIILKSRGNQLFSYVHVLDAVTAILTIVTNGTIGEAYNIADKKSEITLKNLAELIADIAHTDVVLDIPDEIEASGYSKATKALLDVSKIEAIGWRAKIDIKDGLRGMVN